MNLKFDKDGLIPAIVQDYYTKEVLTLAYMNEESLKISLKEKKTCFFSRSRQELWRKGETSGNYQHIVSINADCDKDALVIEVIKDGPACHLGKESCFSNELFFDEDKVTFSYENLYKMIEDRRDNKKEGSYTSYLFEKGTEKILKKVGEEATEVIIAATKNDRDETIYEISDLMYHTLVLMIDKNISLIDLKKEMEKRHIIDFKIKQEKMK